MRITMLGSGSYRGSLSIRIVALGQQLAKIGWDVAIVVPSADKYNNFTKERIVRDGQVAVIQPWQPATRRPILNLIPYLGTSIIAGFMTKPDIVYLYKPTPITIFGLLIKLFFGTPVILDLDDLGSEVMRAQHQSTIQTWLVALCERLALRYATAVVVTSTFLRARILAQYPDKTVLVLPNGVDASLYPIRAPKPVRSAIYYFGLVNRFSLVAPLLAAIPRVLKAVPGARFTIIGGGTALGEAQAYAEKLGVAASIHFTGYTDMLGVTKYTEFGDIGVCYQPDIDTVRAASNMKVFQYMAMSTVTIVSKVGDLPGYLDDGGAGRAVEADSHEALASAIVDLLLDERGRADQAIRARELAETIYSWATLSDQLSAFIERVTHKSVDHGPVEKA